MSLKERLASRDAAVGVVGLGYVGLPLAIEAARVGYRVVGYDIDPERVEHLAAGRSPLEDVSDEDLSGQLEAGKFTPTADVEDLDGLDVFVMCVPTPLKHELPDMSYIEAAANQVARFVRPDTLVILESTTYPGTTEEFLQPLLESGGLKAGDDFFMGFSPERIDPGNERFGLRNTPKIIGAVDESSAGLMESFYSAFVEQIVPVSSPTTAETAKLLENTYRHINIALANEMAILCHDLGVDIWEVIEAAKTKPFGFHAFYPGPGWGGHCIPVDPAYLSWRVRQLGDTARFVELAREINHRMPSYVMQRISECLNDQNKSVRGAKVLALGVTYKRDVGDIRESPAIRILERLQKAGADVRFHDPFVEQLDLKHGPLARADLEAALGEVDLVVVITDHSHYDWAIVAQRAKLILDTRNAMRGVQGEIFKL